MKLIVDTSILIDNLRGGTVLESILDDLSEENFTLFIATIVIFEIYSGKSTKNSKTVSEIDRLLDIFQRIELNEKIAKLAGELCRDIGTHIDPEDYIVAASSLSIGGTVLTLNRKHFEQIPNLSLYPL